jgi:hypothetical protein
MIRTAPEGLHCDDGNSGIVAGFDASLYFLVLHQAEVVTGHYHVNPVMFCGSGEVTAHVFVIGKAKEAYELLLFCFFDPLF